MFVCFVCLFVCLVLNDASTIVGGINLNMMWLEKVQILQDKIKGMTVMILYNDN